MAREILRFVLQRFHTLDLRTELYMGTGELAANDLTPEEVMLGLGQEALAALKATGADDADEFKRKLQARADEQQRTIADEIERGGTELPNSGQ